MQTYIIKIHNDDVKPFTTKLRELESNPNLKIVMIYSSKKSTGEHVLKFTLSSEEHYILLKLNFTFECIFQNPVKPYWNNQPFHDYDF